MQTGQYIALLCANCGTNIRRSVSDWIDGFECPECGNLIQRPGKQKPGKSVLDPTITRPTPKISNLPVPLPSEANASVSKAGAAAEDIADHFLVPHLENEIKNLTKRIAELEQASSESALIAQYKRELEMQKAENSELRKAIKDLAVDAARAQHELEENLVKNRELFNEAQDLRVRLRSAELDRDTLAGEVEDLKSRLSDVPRLNRQNTERLQKLSLEHEQLQSEFTKLTSNMTTTSDELREAHKEAERLKHELKTSNQQEIDSLREQIDKLEAEARQATIDAKLVKDKLGSVLKEKVAATKALEEARKGAEEAQKSVEEAKQAEARSRHKETVLAEKAKEAIKTRATTEAKYKALLAKLGTLMKAEEDWITERVELEAQLEAARKAAEAAREATPETKADPQELQILKLENEILHEKIDNLAAALTEARHQQFTEDSKLPTGKADEESAKTSDAPPATEAEPVKETTKEAAPKEATVNETPATDEKAEAADEESASPKEEKPDDDDGRIVLTKAKAKKKSGKTTGLKPSSDLQKQLARRRFQKD